LSSALALLFFFFQAEDGIRAFHVTGVQTCALPIYKTVSSYLTFSPLPRHVGAVCFLWHLLSPIARSLPVRKRVALCCPDFPLPRRYGAAIEPVCFTTKVYKKAVIL